MLGGGDVVGGGGDGAVAYMAGGSGDGSGVNLVTW